MSKHQVQLAEYSKHTPRLLRHQIMCALMKKYVPHKQDEMAQPNTSEESYGSSIQRFHGALLFVDISGFTALSLKLDVETLKNHINSYFSKMLDIVEKWDGDVVKFAGDALFIIWPTLVDHTINPFNIEGHTSHSSSTPSVNSQFAISAKRALEKAVACGLEISSVCGNYEVKLTEHSTESSGILSRLLPSFLLVSGQKVVPSSSTTGEASSKPGKGDDYVYLNVHSGVSSGLMASIDLLSPNRGEFFLIGEPLTGVAMAESQASKGDVVLCTSSHELLHGDNANQALSRHLGLSGKGKYEGGEGGGDEEGELVELQVSNQPISTKVHGVTIQCGCHRTPNGLYRVSKLLTRRSNAAKSMGDKRKTRGRLKAEQTKMRNEWSAINEKCYEEISHDIEKLLSSSQLSIKQAIYAFLKSYHRDSSLLNMSIEELNAKEAAAMEIGEQTDIDMHSFIGHKDEDRHLASMMWANVKKHFSDWMDHSLLTYITLHVHEVERLYHLYKSNPSALSSLSFHEVLSKSVRGMTDSDMVSSTNTAGVKIENDISTSVSLSAQDSVSTSEHEMQFEVPSSSRDSISVHSDADMDKQALLSPKSKRSSQEKSMKGFSTELNNGEIRSVIVLFIKIEKFDLRLRIDAVGKPRNFAYNRFSFLDRTESEIEADEQLMRRFQACFSVLCKALSDHGGQLRQFIVDDKGTVCIGTFGLRGSTSVDNAAAAVAAAKQIVDGLKASGLSAAIGITSGKGYCGSVGSAVRHEYAVMGPSTNLSARLMCKAPQNGMICDADTVDRDRKHHFEPLGEIQAKGYSRPVMTYIPVFEFQEDEQVGMGYFRFPSSKRLLFTSKRYGNAVKSAIASIASVKTFSAPTVPKKLTMKEKIQELCKSDFYITDSRNHFYSDEGKVRQLYGRQAAVSVILPFLLDSDTEHNDALLCTGHAKVVVVCGASGIGKTTVLDAIEHKLQIFIRSDPKFNAVVIRSRVHNIRQGTPFGIWQLLLTKLLSFVKKTVMSSGSASVTGETRRSISISVTTSSVSLTTYQDVLDFLWPHLPVEYQDQRQVLNKIISTNEKDAVGVTEDDEDDSDSVLEKGIDLLAALLQAILEQTKKLVIILM
ncbi:adenylate/guanylate cyclase domain-containing protein [archaeon]|nr:MAG: adenylate/guanylate cyclase domain-containing protein [archaeon]